MSKSRQGLVWWQIANQHSISAGASCRADWQGWGTQSMQLAPQAAAHLAGTGRQAWDGVKRNIRPLLVVQPPDPPYQGDLLAATPVSPSGSAQGLPLAMHDNTSGAQVPTTKAQLLQGQGPASPEGVRIRGRTQKG